jgi:hypothetical protein
MGVDYDEWKTRTPRDVEVIVDYCEQCGGEIYLHNPFYRTNIGRIHEDCFDDFAYATLGAELVEGFEGLLDN